MRSYWDTRKVKNLFNGIKYFFALSMSSLAIARSMSNDGDVGINTWLDCTWVTVSIITTLYAFWWDTVMDWGLCQCFWGKKACNDSESHPFLLRDTMYFSPGVYYTAMLGNFIMRLGWAFLISPEQTYVKQNYILLLGSIELIRRFVWAIFRIEWEDIERSKNVEHII